MASLTRTTLRLAHEKLDAAVKRADEWCAAASKQTAEAYERADQEDWCEQFDEGGVAVEAYLDFGDAADDSGLNYDDNKEEINRFAALNLEPPIPTCGIGRAEVPGHDDQML